MATYLIHQARDGSPLGIFSETDHFYFAHLAAKHEAYGVSVVQSRGSRTDWDEWAEEQASKSPGPRGMWDTYSASDYLPLEDLLLRVRDQTTY